MKLIDTSLLWKGYALVGKIVLLGRRGDTLCEEGRYTYVKKKERLLMKDILLFAGRGTLNKEDNTSFWADHYSW